MSSFIKEYRSERGISQSALAEMLGVETRTISRWEVGGCHQEKLVRLAFMSLEAHRVQELNTHGPAAAIPLADRRRAYASRHGYTFYRDEDGAWRERQWTRALPMNATWWESEFDGRWVQRRFIGAEYGGRLTGAVDRWPAYEWWKEIT